VVGVAVIAIIREPKNVLDQLKRLPIETCCKICAVYTWISNDQCQTVLMVESARQTGYTNPQKCADQLKRLPIETCWKICRKITEISEKYSQTVLVVERGWFITWALAFGTWHLAFDFGIKLWH